MAQPRSELTRFITTLPFDMPVAEVIAKAKAKGLTTSENNVYRVRRLHRNRAKKAQAKNLASKAPVNGVKPPTKPVASVSSAEAALRRAIVEVGVARAEALLSDVKAKLAAIVGD